MVRAALSWTSPVKDCTKGPHYLFPVVLAPKSCTEHQAIHESPGCTTLTLLEVQFKIDEFTGFKSTASIRPGPLMKAINLMKLKGCKVR